VEAEGSGLGSDIQMETGNRRVECVSIQRCSFMEKLGLMETEVCVCVSSLLTVGTLAALWCLDVAVVS
jgi:hypothetical protein